MIIVISIPFNKNILKQKSGTVNVTSTIPLW
jgi:hypothetical protein